MQGAPTRCSLGGGRSDDRQTIITRIEQFRQFDLPILFDPGQAVTSLGKAQLEYALNAARWLIVNEFERGYIESLLGKPITDAGANLEAIIVTLGGAGRNSSALA